MALLALSASSGRSGGLLCRGFIIGLTSLFDWRTRAVADVIALSGRVRAIQIVVTGTTTAFTASV